MGSLQPHRPVVPASSRPTSSSPARRSASLPFEVTAAHPKTASALQQQARATLQPFRTYLGQAKTAAEQRQTRYALPWRSVERQQSFVLEPMDTLVRVEVPDRGWRLLEWPSEIPLPREEPLMVVSHGIMIPVRHTEVDAGGPRLHLDEPLPEGAKTFWGGRPCHLVRERHVEPPTSVVGSDGTPHRVRRASDAGGTWTLVLEGVFNGRSLWVDERALPATPIGASEHLKVTDGSHSWTVAGGRILSTEPPQGEVLWDSNDRRYRWRLEHKRPRNGVWIELLLPEAGGGDTGLDPRAAFCEDDIDEVWSAKHHREATTFKVRRVDRDRFRLQLDELPSEDVELLYLPINLHNLKLQQRAVNQLSYAPLPHHQGLLRLCEDPQKVRWPTVAPETPTRWYVLTDDTRDGTREQRRFVAKALGSARAPHEAQGGDITVLEGPPGSGKTTAITELVRQLQARGQRVLFCASTHNAIDNVIERIGDDVDVVRVGREENVDPSVRHRHLGTRVDALVAQWRQVPKLATRGDATLREMAERTIVAGADLTCGTTMGILRHPSIHQRKRDGQRPLATRAEWDVLIVDEASKTTIHEFFVPAVFARRWVIVGDVQQLPPFSDRSEIVANLRGLVDREGRPLFDTAEQRAHLIAWRLGRPAIARTGASWLVVEPQAVISALERILTSRSQPDWVRVGHTDSGLALSVASIKAGALGALRLATARWVLVPQHLFLDVREHLPSTLLTMNHAPQGLTLDYRRAYHQATAKRLAPVVHERGRRLTTLGDLEANETTWLSHKDWAGELAWRVTRMHELKRARGKERSRLAEQVDQLLPPSADARDAVVGLTDVALPSIIEVLQEGIGGARATRRSALTLGIAAHQPQAWRHRFERLSYQHRMHPELSALPRALFYAGDALRDANTVQDRIAHRPWRSGASRLAWHDIRGDERAGENAAEVTAMRDLLSDFVAWASDVGRDRSWEIACLTFYTKQEAAIRRMLKSRFGGAHRHRYQAGNVTIVSSTVDRFQGREADLVLLSMRNTRRVGFLDSVNRLNVALTRAREEVIVIGNHDYYRRRVDGALHDLAEQASRLYRTR